jgi:hypothetical protein
VNGDVQLHHDGVHKAMGPSWAGRRGQGMQGDGSELHRWGWGMQDDGDEMHRAAAIKRIR